MARQIAITKRIDLSDLDVGWEGCYAVVTGANYPEYLELQGMDTTDEATAVARGIEIAKAHFIKGELMILDDSGESSRVAMEADDINGNRELADRIIAVVFEVPPDPKGSSTATATSSTAKQQTSTSDTKTQ